jgi:ribosomal protein S18 acetylase RimI-like enzyme
VRSVSFDTSFLLKLDPAVDRVLRVLARDSVPCFVTATVLSEIERLNAWGRLPPGQYELAVRRCRRAKAKPVDLKNRLAATEIGRRCARSMERYHGVKPDDVTNDCAVLASSLSSGVDLFLSEDWHLTSRVTDEVIREMADAGCAEYSLMCGGTLYAITARVFLKAYSGRRLDTEAVEALRRDVRKPGKMLKGSMELTFALGRSSEAEIVWKAVTEAIERHRADGIFQWGSGYPTRDIFKRDLERGHLHVARLGGRFAGFIVLDEEQGEEWDGIPWATSGKILVAHRLVVKPEFQGRGIGGGLVDYAERLGRGNGYEAIRLDAYQGNPRALLIYESRGYRLAGTFRFPEDHGLIKGFNCYEKELRRSQR